MKVKKKKRVLTDWLTCGALDFGRSGRTRWTSAHEQRAVPYALGVFAATDCATIGRCSFGFTCSDKFVIKMCTLFSSWIKKVQEQN